MKISQLKIKNVYLPFVIKILQKRDTFMEYTI